MPKNIINANYTHDKRSISRIFNKSYSPDTIHIQTQEHINLDACILSQTEITTSFMSLSI
jgi:hypothetical protein